MAGLVGSGKGKHLNDRSMQRNRDIYRKIPKGHRDRCAQRPTEIDTRTLETPHGCGEADTYT